MNGYLVPANTKKSLLIFNMLRPFDAILLGAGIGISVILLLLTESIAGVFGASGDNIWILLLACLPMLISLILVLPIPNYHNTLVGIQSILNFYNGRRNYIWRGWCIQNEFKDDK